VPRLGPLARAFVSVNRVLGAFALIGGLLLLAKCAWHLFAGTRQWSQSYFAVLFGVTLVIAGIVYLKAPLWRSRSKTGSDASVQDD